MNSWRAGVFCVFLVLDANASSVVKLTPPKLDFGSLPVGTASPLKTATLTNISNSAVTVRDISVSGIDFAETNTCPSSLGYGNDSVQNGPFGELGQSYRSRSSSNLIDFQQLRGFASSAKLLYLWPLPQKHRVDNLFRIKQLWRCGHICRESLPYPSSSSSDPPVSICDNACSTVPSGTSSSFTAASLSFPSGNAQ